MTYLSNSEVIFGLANEVQALQRQAQTEPHVRLPDRTIDLMAIEHPTRGFIPQVENMIEDFLNTPRQQERVAKALMSDPELRKKVDTSRKATVIVEFVEV